MTDMVLPKRGDLVLVRWPRGPYDFLIEFESLEPADKDGWMLIEGVVVEPSGPGHRRMRKFYVKAVEGVGYSLLPKQQT